MSKLKPTIIADPLDHIMSAEEAAEKWDLSYSHVKRLCVEGKVHAKKIGNSWVIPKTWPNPKQKG